MINFELQKIFSRVNWRIDPKKKMQSVTNSFFPLLHFTKKLLLNRNFQLEIITLHISLWHLQYRPG